MIWHALIAAAAWWASASSGCPVKPVAAPAPKQAAVVPRDHWAYQAVVDLAAAGWDIPGAPAAGPGNLTRERFTTITARLVAAAAARERVGPPLPMAQRALLCRLVAEFVPVGSAAADAARVPGLHPEVVSSPDNSREARFVPTASGSEITIVEKAAQKTIQLPADGYNYGPVWSQDGDEVAWLSYTEGRTLVWLHSLLSGDDHMIGSALSDRWGKLTPVQEGFTLSLPGLPDRLVRIPGHLEPENNKDLSKTTAPDKAN